MAPEERIIEFETVKKGRKVIFFALIGVFAALSIAFMLMWIFKTSGINAQVSDIQLSNNEMLLSRDENNNEILIASANAEYKVEAVVGVVGDVSSSLSWRIEPESSFEKPQQGVDAENPNLHFFTFKVKPDIVDGTEAKITARSVTTGEVTASFKFVLKAQYAGDLDIVNVKSGKDAEAKVYEPKRKEGSDDTYEIVLPYFANTIPTHETLNFNYLFFRQIGEIDSNNREAKLTKGVIGLDNKYVNTLEYELVNVKPSGAVSFESSSGSAGSVGGSVLNTQDMTTLAFKSAGTFTLKVTANKYNNAEEIVRYLEVTLKNSNEYDEFLSSISFNNTALDLFLNEITLDKAIDVKSVLKFSPEKPKSDPEWKYKVFESNSSGDEILPGDTKLQILGTKILPQKAGYTYITAKDTSPQGYGVSTTKIVNVYAAVEALGINTVNTIKDKYEYQRGDNIEVTANFTIQNPQNIELKVSNIKHVLEFVYGSKEYEPKLEGNLWVNAVDTVILPGMVDTGREDASRRKIYRIDPASLTGVSLTISKDSKSASISYNAKIGANAPADVGITFFTVPQSYAGDFVVYAKTLSLNIKEAVTDLVFKDSPVIAESDRFFKAANGEYYLIRPLTSGGVSNFNSVYKVFDLFDFMAGNKVVPVEENVLPFGVKIEAGNFARLDCTGTKPTYRFATTSDRSSEKVNISIPNQDNPGTYKVFSFNVVYQVAPAELKLADISGLLAGSEREIYYKPNESAAVSQNVFNTDSDKLNATYYSNVGGSALLFTYVFIGEKMLYHDTDGKIYLDDSKGTPIFKITNTLSDSVGKVEIIADLFALQLKERIAANKFKIVYSYVPLKYSSEPDISALVVNETATSNFTYRYDDYAAFEDIVAKGMLASRNYTALRSFDDIAFFTDENYTDKLANRTVNNATTYETTASRDKEFELYPSGIIVYGNAEQYIVGNKTEYADFYAQILAKNNEPHNHIEYLGSRYRYRITNNEKYNILLSTRTLKWSPENTVDNGFKVGTVKVEVDVRSDILEIASIQAYAVRTGSGSLINFEKQLSADSVIPLLDNGMTVTVYLKITYKTYTIGQNFYESIKEHIGNNIPFSYNINDTYADAQNTRPISGIALGDTPVVSDISIDFWADSGQKGIADFIIESIVQSETRVECKFKVDVTTAINSISINEVDGNEITDKQEIILTAKAGGLDDKTVGFEVAFKMDAAKVMPNLSNNHLNLANIEFVAYSGTTKLNEEAVKDLIATASLAQTSDSRTYLRFTVSTNNRCYETIELEVKVKYLVYTGAFDADGKNIIETKTLSAKIKLKFSAEIYAVSINPAVAGTLNAIDIFTTGANGNSTAGFVVDCNGANPYHQVFARTVDLTATALKLALWDDTVDNKSYINDANNSMSINRADNTIVISNKAKDPNTTIVKIKAEIKSSNISAMTVYAEKNIKIQTLDVNPLFKNFTDYSFDNGGAGTHDDGKNITIYHFANSIDLGLGGKNKWNQNTVTLGASRYTLTYSIDNNSSRLSINANTGVVAITGTDPIEFVVTAKVVIEGQTNDADNSYTIYATVYAFDRPVKIRTTQIMPGQTNYAEESTPVTGTLGNIKISLVEGRSFDVAKYIELLNSKGEKSRWQDFELVISGSTNGYLSKVGTVLTANKISGTYGPATSYTVTIKAKVIPNDDAGAILASRVIEVKLYRPELDGKQTGGSILNLPDANSDSIYEWSIFPATNELTAKFDIDYIAKDIIDPSDITVIIVDGGNKFTNSGSTTGGTHSYIFGLGIITANDIGETFTLQISYKIDGILFSKSFDFVLTAELTDAQKQAFAITLKQGNDNKTNGSVEGGILAPDDKKITIHIADTNSVISSVISNGYGVLTYELFDTEGNPLLIGGRIVSVTAVDNNLKSVITLSGLPIEFYVSATLKLFNSNNSALNFVSSELLADTNTSNATDDGYPMLTVTNNSELETFMYVGTSYTSKTLISVNASGVATSNPNVSFDTIYSSEGAYDQKLFYIVVSYDEAGYNIVYNKDAFTPMFSSTGNVLGRLVESEHDVANNLFYAAYTIERKGTIENVCGTISINGLTYTSAALSVTFAAPELSGTWTNDITHEPQKGADAEYDYDSYLKANNGFLGDLEYSFTVFDGKNGKIENDIYDDSGFITIEFIRVDGKLTGEFKVIPLRYDATTTVLGGSISLEMSIEVKSGIYKGTVINKRITVTITEFDRPTLNYNNVLVLDKDTTHKDIFNIVDYTSNIFTFTSDSTDTDFEITHLNESSTNTFDLTKGANSDTKGSVAVVSDVLKYTPPNTAAHDILSGKFTVTDGYWTGLEFDVVLNIYTEPTITLEIFTTEALDVSTTDTFSYGTVTIKVSADKFVSQNKMTIKLLNVDFGTVTAIKEIYDSTNEIYYYTATYRADMFTAGGIMNLQAEATIQDGVFRGKIFESNIKQITVRSIDINDNNSINKVTGTKGEKILTLAPGESFVFVSGNIATTNIKGLIDSTYVDFATGIDIDIRVTGDYKDLVEYKKADKRLTIKPGANFSNDSKNDIIEIIVTSGGKKFVSYVHLVITKLVVPDVDYSIDYKWSDIVASTVDLTDTASPYIYEGDKLIFSFKDISETGVTSNDYPIENVTVELKIGNTDASQCATFVYDPDTQQANFTALKATSALKVTNIYAYVYGVKYKLADFTIEIREAETDTLTVVPSSNQIISVGATGNGTVTATIAETTSPAYDLYELIIEYNSNLFGIVLKDNLDASLTLDSASTAGRLIYKYKGISDVKLEDLEISITAKNIASQVSDIYISVRYAEDDDNFANLYKTKFSLEIIKKDGSLASIYGSKTKPFLHDDLALFVTSQKLKDFEVVSYEIKDDTSNKFELVGKDVLRVKDKSGTDPLSVKIVATINAGGINFKEEKSFTFYPYIANTLAANTTDDVVTLTFDPTTYGLTAADISYSVSNDTPLTQDAVNKNIFKYNRTSPNAAGFKAIFIITVNKESSIYHGMTFTKEIFINIAAAAAPTLSASASSNADNTGEITVSLEQLLEDEFVGEVSYEILSGTTSLITITDEEGTAIAQKTDSIDLGKKFKFVKHPSLTGTALEIKITVKLGDDDVNNVYKDKSYSTTIYINVEPATIKTIVIPSSNDQGLTDMGLTGGFTTNFAGIYEETNSLSGVTYELINDSGTVITTSTILELTGNTYKKIATKNGGIQKIKATYTGGYSEIFSIIVEPIDISVVVNETKGEIEVSVTGGMYASSSTFDFVGGDRGDLGLIFLDKAEGDFAKRLSLTGGGQYVKIVTTVNGIEFTSFVTITANASTINLNKEETTKTLTLKPTTSANNTDMTITIIEGSSLVEESVVKEVEESEEGEVEKGKSFTKQPTATGGTVKIEVKFTNSANVNDYISQIVEWTVEKAELFTTITSTSGDIGLTGTLATNFAGIYEETNSLSGVTYELVNDSGTVITTSTILELTGNTYKKIATKNGGVQKIKATYTGGYSEIFSIVVESIDVSVVVNETKGEIEVSVTGGMYASSSTFDFVGGDRGDLGLIFLDKDKGEFAKRLSTYGGEQYVIVVTTVNGIKFTSFVAVEVEAVNITAKLSGTEPDFKIEYSIDTTDVDLSITPIQNAHLIDSASIVDNDGEFSFSTLPSDDNRTIEIEIRYTRGSDSIVEIVEINVSKAEIETSGYAEDKIVDRIGTLETNFKGDIYKDIEIVAANLTYSLSSSSIVTENEFVRLYVDNEDGKTKFELKHSLEDTTQTVWVTYKVGEGTNQQVFRYSFVLNILETLPEYYVNFDKAASGDEWVEGLITIGVADAYKDRAEFSYEFINNAGEVIDNAGLVEIKRDGGKFTIIKNLTDGGDVTIRIKITIYTIMDGVVTSDIVDTFIEDIEFTVDSAFVISNQNDAGSDRKGTLEVTLKDHYNDYKNADYSIDYTNVAIELKPISESFFILAANGKFEMLPTTDGGQIGAIIVIVGGDEISIQLQQAIEVPAAVVVIGKSEEADTPNGDIYSNKLVVSFDGIFSDSIIYLSGENKNVEVEFLSASDELAGVFEINEDGEYSYDIADVGKKVMLQLTYNGTYIVNLEFTIERIEEGI